MKLQTCAVAMPVFVSWLVLALLFVARTSFENTRIRDGREGHRDHVWDNVSNTIKITRNVSEIISRCIGLLTAEMRSMPVGQHCRTQPMVEKRSMKINGSRVNATEQGVENHNLRPVYIAKRFLYKVSKLGVAKDNCHNERLTDWACFFCLFDDCSCLVSANRVHSNGVDLNTS